MCAMCYDRDLAVLCKSVNIQVTQGRPRDVRPGRAVTQVRQLVGRSISSLEYTGISKAGYD